MNLSKPLTSLIPSLEGDVLTVLAGADYAFTGRQIHRVIGKNSQVGVSKVLIKLTAQGLVTTEPAGSSNIYRLNREHLLAKYVIGAANVRAEFYQRLGEEVATWPLSPECVAIFGSSNRKDMTPESDVDVFISRSPAIDFGNPAWRGQLTDFSLKVERWTGNVFQIFEVGYEDIRKELAVKDDVIYSIIEQGVVVYGPSDYLQTLHAKADGQ